MEENYETTCIPRESFSSVLENYLMILRPYVQCESPYFHSLWYFYLRLLSLLRHEWFDTSTCHIDLEETCNCLQ